MPTETISKEKESCRERVGRELQTSEQRTVRAKITKHKVGALPPTAYAQPKSLVERRKVLSQDDCKGDDESLNFVAARELFVQL